MEQSNFCMEQSDFDYGANWLLIKAKWLGTKWPWGEVTGDEMTMGWSDWGRNDHGVKWLDTFHVLRGKTVGVLYEKGAEEEAFSYSPLTL